jgi:DNA-binding MarR family transcriptional regulator
LRASASLKLADYMPYRLSVAAHAVSTLIGAGYEARFQLPIPQWRVLAIVAEKLVMRQQDLVSQSTMDKQTVSRAVRALQRRGMLQRLADRNDGRAYVLRLSVRGQRLYARVSPLAVAYERQLLRALPRNARAATLRALRQLQQVAQSLHAAQFKQVI